MTAKEAEAVVCRVCSEENLIKESTLCPCGTRLFTSHEIKLQLGNIQKQLSNLNFTAMALSAELELRKTRRANFRQSYLISVSKNPEEFFKNVHMAPRGGTGRKASSQSSIREKKEGDGSLL